MERYREELFRGLVRERLDTNNDDSLEWSEIENLVYTFRRKGWPLPSDVEKIGYSPVPIIDILNKMPTLVETLYAYYSDFPKPGQTGPWTYVYSIYLSMYLCILFISICQCLSTSTYDQTLFRAATAIQFFVVLVLTPSLFSASGLFMSQGL